MPVCFPPPCGQDAVRLYALSRDACPAFLFFARRPGGGSPLQAAEVKRKEVHSMTDSGTWQQMYAILRGGIEESLSLWEDGRFWKMKTSLLTALDRAEELSADSCLMKPPRKGRP